jgi:RNA polymerase sigma-70 factor, ECF subfamily
MRSSERGVEGSGDGAGEDGLSQEVFEEQRGTLIGIAYRLLGSMWDAEDVVQDAYLRWLHADREHVRSPRAFLITVVTRLALDHHKSARVKRETYVGPWLPEPVTTAELGPLDTAEIRDTVSFATLHLLERLAPPERAVFILREAFGLSYEEIAEVVETSVVNCRQMYSRASVRVNEPRIRFEVNLELRRRLVREFLQAASTGDLQALQHLLHDDVIAYVDGGGRVRAALRPILGRENAIRFMSGLVTRFGVEHSQIVELNGESAVITRMANGTQVVLFDIVDGLIRQVFVISNPDKLHFVEQ